MQGFHPCRCNYCSQVCSLFCSHPFNIIDFFSKNMVQQSHGEICNAHVIHADLSELGALDVKYLKLAKLAAVSVDFPKTAKPVTNLMVVQITCCSYKVDVL